MLAQCSISIAPENIRKRQGYRNGTLVWTGLIKKGIIVIILTVLFPLALCRPGFERLYPVNINSMNSGQKETILIFKCFERKDY